MKSLFLKDNITVSLKIGFDQIGNRRQRCLLVSYEKWGCVTGVLPRKILNIFLAHSPTIQTQGLHPHSPRWQPRFPPTYLYFREHDKRKDREADKTQQLLSSFLCTLDSFPSFNFPISMCQLSSRKIPGNYHATHYTGHVSLSLLRSPAPI